MLLKMTILLYENNYYFPFMNIIQPEKIFKIYKLFILKNIIKRDE